MKTPFRNYHLLVLATLCCAMTSGPRAHAQDDPIAMMDADGSNAFIDNARQPPSVSDAPIQDGNMVRTGQRTSALIEFIPQGTVQLNENSAKLISWSFFKGARCLAVRLIAGELFINGENVCFVTNLGPVSGISHSRINIKVDERGTVLTVIEGAAELEGKPATMLVSTSEQLIVLPNGEYYKNPIDPAAAERTAEWTKNYFNAPPPKKGMSKGAKVALGVLGAIILGKAIHEATDDDDDDDDDNRPPPTQPYPPSPPRDAPPPPPHDTQPQLPAGKVLQTSPVYQPRLEDCCVEGRETRQLTPAQCAAVKGTPGKCLRIN